jgi:hypothetical protein
MRRMRDVVASAIGRKSEPRTVYVGSYEDKLSRLAPMRVDPDDDGRTREDVELQQKAKRRGNFGGGPVRLDR